MTTTAALPAPPPPPVGASALLAALLASSGDLPEAISRITRAHGPTVRLPLRGGVTVISRPEDIRHVLHDHVKRYPRGHSVDYVRPILGNGLPLSDGALWLRQRRIMSPAFNRARIAALLPVMARVAERHAERLRDGERVDAHHLMMLLTRDVIVETMFSDEIGADTEALDEALEEINAFMAFRAFVPVWFPLRVPTPGNVRFNRAIAALERILNRVVSKRRARGDHRDDLLDALLGARDPETGEAMPDAQLRDEVITIFFAGHETTANTLTWTLLELTRHPEVEARMREEIARVLGGRAPAADDVAGLEYTSAVIRESLRLHPATWTLLREAEEDDVVGGRFIAKGSTLLVLMYAAQRSPEHWPDPDRFDPERFLRDPSLAIGNKSCTYMPFGVGPHTCIGNHFAMAEATIILATLLQRMRLVVERPEKVRPALAPLLRVAGGLPVRVHRDRREARR